MDTTSDFSNRQFDLGKVLVLFSLEIFIGFLFLVEESMLICKSDPSSPEHIINLNPSLASTSMLDVGQRDKANYFSGGMQIKQETPVDESNLDRFQSLLDNEFHMINCLQMNSNRTGSDGGGVGVGDMSGKRTHSTSYYSGQVACNPQDAFLSASTHNLHGASHDLNLNLLSHSGDEPPVANTTDNDLMNVSTHESFDANHAIDFMDSEDIPSTDEILFNLETFDMFADLEHLVDDLGAVTHTNQSSSGSVGGASGDSAGTGHDGNNSAKYCTSNTDNSQGHTHQHQHQQQQYRVANQYPLPAPTSSTTATTTVSVCTSTTTTTTDRVASVPVSMATYPVSARYWETGRKLSCSTAPNISTSSLLNYNNPNTAGNETAIVATTGAHHTTVSNVMALMAVANRNNVHLNVLSHKKCLVSTLPDSNNGTKNTLTVGTGTNITADTVSQTNLISTAGNKSGNEANLHNNALDLSSSVDENGNLEMNKSGRVGHGFCLHSLDNSSTSTTTVVDGAATTANRHQTYALSQQLNAPKTDNGWCGKANSHECDELVNAIFNNQLAGDNCFLSKPNSLIQKNINNKRTNEQDCNHFTSVAHTNHTSLSRIANDDTLGHRHVNDNHSTTYNSQHDPNNNSSTETATIADYSPEWCYPEGNQNLYSYFSTSKNNRFIFFIL